MNNRDETIKAKMDNHIKILLAYDLSDNDKNYLLEHATKLFTLQSIDDKTLAVKFLRLITNYYENGFQRMFKKSKK